MRIKVNKRLYVNSDTLIRLEWRKYYPVLIVHEKFEKKVKWLLRGIAFIGIATSIIAIDRWYFSLGLSLLIFGVEQFLESTIFEYTTMVVQPPPDFEIDYTQWVTNCFAFPMEKNTGAYTYFGPAYLSKEYGTKFFGYLQQWSHGNNDKENNIIVSFVIEPDEKYTTYLYANFERKSVDSIFDIMRRNSSLTKYGKQQQRFIFQMVYWNTLTFKEGYMIKRFLDDVKPDDKFVLIPGAHNVQTDQTEHLFELGIMKYGYKLRNRGDLNKNDPEYFFDSKKYKDEPKVRMI